MDPNNPATVPPLLSAIDQPQEGLPRVIHPIGMLVGRPDPSAVGVVMDEASNTGFVTVPVDGTYRNVSGVPSRFRAGARIPVSRAASYPDLVNLIPGRALPEARNVTPPENESFAVPETRGGMVVTSARAGAKPATIKELRGQAEAEGIEIPKSVTKRDDIAAVIEAARGEK